MISIQYSKIKRSHKSKFLRVSNVWLITALSLAKIERTSIHQFIFAKLSLMRCMSILAVGRQLLLALKMRGIHLRTNNVILPVKRYGNLLPLYGTLL